MVRFERNSIIGALAIGAATLVAATALAAEPVNPTAGATSAATPPVAPAGTVVIGNFAGSLVHSDKYGPFLRNGPAFGWGWSLSTDRRMGGHSTATMTLVHPGADGTKGALRVTGAIRPGFPAPWAGPFWFAGREPMQPANLSAKNELVFRAKGTPGRYVVMLLSGSGYIPHSTPFVLTSKWKEYHISLKKSFPDADWTQVRYLGFSAGKPGKFEFEVDQVSLR